MDTSRSTYRQVSCRQKLLYCLNDILFALLARIHEASYNMDNSK